MSQPARALVISALLGACGSSADPAPPIAPEPPPTTTATADPVAPPVEPPVVATPEPPTAATTEPAAAVALPANLLPDCLWFADPSPPPLEGPGSMDELDERLTQQIGREARVAGRVRLAARGCAHLSAGVAVVRVPEDDPDDEAPMMIADDDPASPPVAGERGDERRDRPWDPRAEDPPAECNGEAPPELYFFRAPYDAGALGAVVVERLTGDVCGLYGHDLQHGDLDRDGTTEIRIEARVGGWEEMTAGTSVHHGLWIYDLAGMVSQLSIELGSESAPEVDGYGSDTTNGDMTFRDVDDDGDRDVVVHRVSEGFDGDYDHPYTYRSFEVHAYDPAGDRWVRAPELDGRVH